MPSRLRHLMTFRHLLQGGLLTTALASRRKTKGLNKAALPSTLASFKRPLLKAPDSNKHGLLGLRQLLEASKPRRPCSSRPGGAQASLERQAGQAAPRPVGKLSRQRMALQASVRDIRCNHCLDTTMGHSFFMLHFTVSPARVVSSLSDRLSSFPSTPLPCELL